MNVNEVQSLTEQSVIFNLTTGKPGERKKVKRSAVKVTAKLIEGEEPEAEYANEENESSSHNPDQNMLHVHKDILDSPELKAVGQFFAKVRKWIAQESLPCDTIKSGMYMVRTTKITKIEAQMAKFQEELQPLLETFKGAYPQRVTESFIRLGALANPLDYPDTERVMKEFKFEYHYLTFQTPKKVLASISSALLQSEEKKLQNHLIGAAEQIQEAFAVSFNDMVNHFLNILQPKDGKKRKVTDGAVEKFNSFCSVFAEQNVFGAGELSDLVEKARALVNGATPEEINSSGDIKTLIATRMHEIQMSIDNFVVNKTGRKIILPPVVTVEETHGTESGASESLQ